MQKTNSQIDDKINDWYIIAWQGDIVLKIQDIDSIACV